MNGDREGEGEGGRGGERKWEGERGRRTVGQGRVKREIGGKK